MHISEAYEHDPLRPYQGENACPLSGCDKVGTQCMDVTAPLTFTPTTVVGTISVSCQGSPEISCVTDETGSTCVVTMTQRVCVSVPIRYGVTMTCDDPTIRCADNCVGSGSC